MTTTSITDDQLREIVESIWNAMLGPLSAGKCGEPARESVRLAASVHIDGAFQGSVSFFATERFARWATAQMLAVPESSLAAEDVDDAVGELCNIVAGGVKSLVPGPSSISLPSVVRGPQWARDDPNTKIAGQLRFTCEGQPLEVRVLEASHLHDQQLAGLR
jgi:chemotaxis protein CheX